MKKELNKIMLVVGFVVTVVGWIIAATTGIEDEYNETVLVYSLMSLVNIATVLGVAFCYAKNCVLKNVGYGLIALVGSEGIGIVTNGNDSETVAAIGLSVMFVAAVLYFFVISLKFFGFVKGGEATCANGNVSSVLMAYKEMKEENVLTEEEFNGLKQKIFENTDQKISSVDDLKKWKKLLDQQVITEEEFSKIKSDIFSK